MSTTGAGSATSTTRTETTRDLTTGPDLSATDRAEIRDAATAVTDGEVRAQQGQLQTDVGAGDTFMRTPQDDGGQVILAQAEGATAVDDRTQTTRTDLPGFEMRFPGQNPGEVRETTAGQIRETVRVIEALNEQPPSADREALLRDANQTLQRDLSHFHLAGGTRADLERARIMGSNPEQFDLQQRVAEAYRRGGDDLATETFDRPGFQQMPVRQAADLMRRHAGDERTNDLLDSAISVASVPYLDTTGLSAAERERGLEQLGTGFFRNSIEATEHVRRTDPQNFGNARYLAGAIEYAAKDDLSEADLREVTDGARMGLGREMFPELLAGAAWTGAGGLIARGVRRLGPTQTRRLLDQPGGVEALSRRLDEAGGPRPATMFSDREVSDALADPEMMRRIGDRVRAQGGRFTVADGDDLRYLDAVGVRASTRQNADGTADITVRPNASPSELFEELIHYGQFRSGRYDAWNAAYGTQGAVLRSEYEAARRLVQNQRAYGIPDAEHAENVRRMEQFRTELQRAGIPSD